MIEKYYKKQKTENILTIKFINYLKLNIYISLDYYKKDKLYKLTWTNLDHEDPTIYMNTEIIEHELVNHILAILKLNTTLSIPNKDKTNIDKVEIDLNIRPIIPGNTHFEYIRYIPNEYLFLVEPFMIISKNLPSKLDNLFIMTLASITGEEYKYNYLNTIKLNILREKIDKVFQPRIVQIGKLLEENIKFIEKIDNTYFALINDLIEYSVIIKEEEKNRVLMNCSCPKDYYCEHIYATLAAIKNKQEIPFYKVLYNDPQRDLLDKITNNKVVLATQIKEDRIQLINEEGQIGLLPILNEEKKCNWTVIEDDKEQTLTKKLEEMEFEAK